MLLNAENKVFVAQRLDSYQDAWQMPQGGIDENEDIEKAAFRELLEEIGTNNATIIAETTDWLTYDLPDDLKGKLWGGKFIGQKQKWFLMRFNGTDGDINIETQTPEFSNYKWVDPQDLPELITFFKRHIYEELLKQFKEHLS